MKFLVPKSKPIQPHHVMQKAGYFLFTDPVTSKESYVLKLTTGYYPRFHVYIKDHAEAWEIDLHLDQKKPSYEGSRMHAGEYDGPTVEKELLRLANWVRHMGGDVQSDLLKPKEESVSVAVSDEPSGEEAGMFGGIFG